MKNRILFAWTNRYGFGFKPPSISHLSAISKKLGFETSLWDSSGIDFSFDIGEKKAEELLIFKPVDWTKYNVGRKKINMEKSFIKHFEDFKPDYLALSVLNDERFLSSRISKAVKEIEPSIIVIWGGKIPHY